MWNIRNLNKNHTFILYCPFLIVLLQTKERKKYKYTQLSQAPLALKIKGDRRRQKEIKDISFVAETGQTEYCPLSSAAEKRLSSFIFLYLLNLRKLRLNTNNSHLQPFVDEGLRVFASRILVHLIFFSEQMCKSLDIKLLVLDSLPQVG